MARSAILLGIVVTFGLLISVALGIGFGSNTYLFQDGSKPLTSDWDTGNFQITNIELWVSDGGEITGDNKITWRDAQISISSDTDGHMDIVADVSIDLNALTVLGSNVLQFWDSDVEVWSDVDSVLNIKVDGYVHIDAPSVFIPIYGSDYGIILSLDFEEGSGTTTFDQSPYGNDGTFGEGDDAPIWTSGKFGTALEFDGDDDYVLVTKDSSIDGAFSEITIMSWIYSVTPAGTVPFSKGAWAADGWYFHIHADGFLQPRFMTDDDNFAWNTPTGSFPLSAWTHVALTYDSANVKYYLNGVLVDTEPVTGDIKSSSTRDLIVGGESITVNNFNGTIDQVRLYNRTLTANEIRTHYLNTRGMYSSSVVVSDNFRILESDLEVDFSVIDGDLSLTGTVDGKDIGGTHTNYYQIRCDEFGRPNTNPPALVEQDNLILFKYTVDTDNADYKMPIPDNYASGDLVFNFYWTNDGGVDDNGKAIKWQLDYQVTGEGESVAGSYADSPESIEDTYASASGWIEHISGAITIEDEDFDVNDCIFLKLTAITPVGDPLTCEPHLIGACLTYTAHNVDDS